MTKATEDSLAASYRKAAELDERIEEQKRKVQHTRSRILKNDVREVVIIQVKSIS